jgi:hypothetical protein
MKRFLSRSSEQGTIQQKVYYILIFQFTHWTYTRNIEFIELMPILLQNERSCYNSGFYYRFPHPSKIGWRKLVRKEVDTLWLKRLQNDATAKNKIKYLAIKHLEVGIFELSLASMDHSRLNFLLWSSVFMGIVPTEVDTLWLKRLQNDATAKNKIKYLAIKHLEVGTSHPLWKMKLKTRIAQSSMFYVSCVHCRRLTYRL